MNNEQAKRNTLWDIFEDLANKFVEEYRITPEGMMASIKSDGQDAIDHLMEGCWMRGAMCIYDHYESLKGINPSFIREKTAELMGGDHNPSYDCKPIPPHYGPAPEPVPIPAHQGPVPEPVPIPPHYEIDNTEYDYIPSDVDYNLTTPVKDTYLTVEPVLDRVRNDLTER